MNPYQTNIEKFLTLLDEAISSEEPALVFDAPSAESIRSFRRMLARTGRVAGETCFIEETEGGRFNLIGFRAGNWHIGAKKQLWLGDGEGDSVPEEEIVRFKLRHLNSTEHTLAPYCNVHRIELMTRPSQADEMLSDECELKWKAYPVKDPARDKAI